MFEVLKKEVANKITESSWNVGCLNGLKYSDLVRILGKPTYSEPTEDNKTQVQWVLLIKNVIFTIYDWKTYNKKITLNTLETWSIGGTTDPIELIKLINSKK